MKSILGNFYRHLAIFIWLHWSYHLFPSFPTQTRLHLGKKQGDQMARLFVQCWTFYNNENLPDGITFWQSRFTILQKLTKPSKVAWIYSSRFCISDNWSYLLIVSVNFVSDRERSSFSCQGNFCHFSIPTHCRFRKYDTSCYDMERKFLPKRRNFAQCCHTGLVEYVATHSNISSFPFGFYYLLDWVCALLLRLLRQMKSP